MAGVSALWGVFLWGDGPLGCRPLGVTVLWGCWPSGVMVLWGWRSSEVMALWGWQSSGGGGPLPSGHLTFLPPRESSHVLPGFLKAAVRVRIRGLGVAGARPAWHFPPAVGLPAPPGSLAVGALSPRAGSVAPEPHACASGARSLKGMVWAPHVLDFLGSVNGLVRRWNDCD